jgi:hypothetical protein
VFKGVFFELGGTSRSLFEDQALTEVTSAYVTFRGGYGDVRVGRQRFLDGPVINSNQGTLLEFDRADAIRWTSAPHNGTTFSVAYLYDMAPLVKGFRQSGLFGRVQAQSEDGVFGVNMLTVNGERGQFGGSVDVAVPLIRRRVDLYGEVGQDPFDNLIYTVGLYFPCLYQDYDTDLFLEYAHRDGMPDLMSARIYHTFDEHWMAVAQIQHFENRNLDLGIGAFYRFVIR